LPTPAFRASVLLALVGAGLVAGAPPGPAAPTVVLPRLSPPATFDPGPLERLLSRGPRVRLGLVVLDAASGQRLYGRNPDLGLTPASNLKLLSLATTLYQLGPDYWFSTSVTRQGALPAPAHLTLVGSGDPSLSVRNGEHSLAGLAAQVYRRGVRRVGAVRVDDHMIGAASWAHPGAERPSGGVVLDEDPGESPSPATALSARAYALRVGGLFRRELQRAGVQVSGGVEVRRGEPGVYRTPLPGDRAGRNRGGQEQTNVWAEPGVATSRSRPLAELLRHTLKLSDNAWADSLSARSGVNERTPSWRPGTRALTRARQDALLRAAGSDPAGLRVLDGSGLSPGNRLSAGAVAALLEYVYRHPLGPGGRNTFIEGLPQGGTGRATPQAAERGGTLATRFLGTGLDLRAKTGTLPGVSSLSGYLRARDGRLLVLSLLADGSAGPGQELRAWQDRLVEALAASASSSAARP
ncbi:MAG: D-alanyl-D-alanine carboxypeptidase/D-alanyl-D-alanine-endopeptidase, partial [Deinococcus sp.]